MLTSLWNFNETFRKDVAHDNIKSLKKPGFNLSQDNGSGGSNSPPPPANPVLEVSIRSFNNINTKVIVEGVL